MPWTYTIDLARNVVFTAGSGVLTEAEVETGVMSLYADPQFRPDLRGLFDYRGVETMKVSSEAMGRLAARRKYSANTRTAFLVKGPLGFGLGRVYQSSVESGHVKITLDRAEAVAWLNEGVPPEKHVA